MKCNVGKKDRIVRFIVAVFFAVLVFSGVVRGITAIVLGVLGLVLFVTGLARRCPLYIPLKIDTREEE